MLVGTAADFSIPKLARRVAINVQRILLGEDPSTFQVVFTRDERLTINMATARKIGVYPSWAALTEATLIDPTRTQEARFLDLGKVVREAVEANLNVRASKQAVATGRQEVAVARSLLLPQFEAGFAAAVIDEDLGSPIQAEKQLTGSLIATQLIFSEKAWANLAVQKRLLAGREAGHRRVYLDVVREATVSYLNVLRALTFERIQRNNLKVSRHNLDLAQVRREVGTSNRSEVFRWQSQIANDQQAVIDANVKRNLAEIDLNRVLHRPLEEPFQPEEIGLDDPRLLIAHTRLKRYMENPGRFRVFRSFLVEEGLSNAPELRQLMKQSAPRNAPSHPPNVASSARPSVCVSKQQASSIAAGRVPNFPPRAVTVRGRRGSVPPSPSSKAGDDLRTSPETAASEPDSSWNAMPREI